MGPKTKLPRKARISSKPDDLKINDCPPPFVSSDVNSIEERNKPPSRRGIAVVPSRSSSAGSRSSSRQSSPASVMALGFFETQHERKQLVDSGKWVTQYSKNRRLQRRISEGIDIDMREMR
eukprot:GHVL01009999.1.p1 GENE.GHVL01009999.1~~GHVL01009999.1.p1  ORF type:complete len:121 (+),score=14.64 GHVL01009999.1:120-482(+)